MARARLAWMLGVGAIALLATAAGAAPPREERPDRPREGPQDDVGEHRGPRRDGEFSRRHVYYYYWPGYYYGYPYPYAYPYRPYGVVIAPLFVDSDAAGFGPRAVQRFFGMDQWVAPNAANRRPILPDLPVPRAVNGPAPAPQQPAQPAAAPAPAVPAGPQAPQVPPAPAGAAAQPSADAQRALLYVDYGDAHFANAKYDEALQRYRRAARLDPNLAAAHLRMGFALAALGKFDLAAEAFKRGLQLDPNWPGSAFTVGQLYGPKEAEKAAHRNALATASAADDRNPDLLFLLGISYFFDGERERAKRCLTEAARLAGRQDAHLQPLLRRL